MASDAAEPLARQALDLAKNALLVNCLLYTSRCV